MSTKSHHEQAYISLTRGLKELDLHGPCVPSNLVLIGDQAFPLALNSNGQVLMAASMYGCGRIVVLGHEGYLTAFPALVENAVTWLKGDGSDSLFVGVHKNAQKVADSLCRSSFQTTTLGAFSSSLEIGVYVTDAYSVGADVQDLVAFMKAGGGVLIGGQAWHWASTHPKENPLFQFPGNKVAGVAGIYFSPHYGKVETVPVSPQIPSSWMTLAVNEDFEDDLKFLLQGVSEFDLQGSLLASEVLAHSTLAFPIGTTKDGKVFLAGAYYGQGRVIVVTHEALLNKNTLASFWNNAIQWLDQGRMGVVGVVPNLSLFSNQTFKCERRHFRGDLSVYVCTVYEDDVDDHVKEIQDFVAEGGGLLVGGHAWSWAQSHSGGNPMKDFSGNKLLNKMGLSLLETTIEAGLYKAPAPGKAMKDIYSFRSLLFRVAGSVSRGSKLQKHEEENLKQLGRDCAQFLKMKANDSYCYTQVLSVLTNILMKSGILKVSEQKPAKSPKDHLLLSIASEVYQACPDPDSLLPYIVKHDPEMPVVLNQKIKINANTKEEHEWLSTGLYLSPGMKTHMIIPRNIINKGWTIQIGCQTDFLRAEELKRPPRVHERFPVDAEKIQVSNLWGGLIYLLAPPNTQVEGIEVMVQKAVAVPYYKSGVTSEGDWTLLRKAPSPWAELEFDNIILTVPSDAVRNLKHPHKVATLWNDIMESVADLAGKPHKFARKERFVADVQISFGLMHAGYPIMMQSFMAAELFNVDDARTKGIWGEIHELGHNQQRSCWEFKPHTTEATCNLWSVYVHEKVLGLNRAKAHPRMTTKNRKQSVDEFVCGGKKLSDWNLWVALETYLQLQEKFGWEALKKVFAAYLKMSNFPSDNAGKMNLYAETFSKIVKMNLCGFFKAWGWPIDRATEESLSNLPPWSNHPMILHD